MPEVDRDHEILLMEFDAEGHLCSVMTGNLDGPHPNYTQYDVDFSQRDGYVYSATGGGPLTPDDPYTVTDSYWIRDEKVPVAPPPDTWRRAGQPIVPVRLQELPPEWNKLGRGPYGWDIFEDMCEGSTEYCVDCRDYLLANSDRVCEHIWWCIACEQFTNRNEVAGEKLPLNPGRCCHCGRTEVEAEEYVCA